MKRERILEIAELLDKRGKLTLEQLEEYFPTVSQMTLRRDLFQLEEELIHLENYLALQKIRFGDSLVIDYDILCTDFEIPALTIQPIVENAINHGIRKRESGGIVTISSYEGKNFYFIEVTDNGVGFDVNQKVKDNKEHVGIKNVRKRLDMMCKGKLKIESEIGKGTKVVIQVPKGGI